MTILDTVLFGMLAGAMTLKVVLLASATVLLVYGIPERIRSRKVASKAHLFVDHNHRIHFNLDPSCQRLCFLIDLRKGCDHRVDSKIPLNVLVDAQQQEIAKVS